MRPDGEERLVNGLNGVLLHNLRENMLGYEFSLESRAQISCG